MRVVNIVEQSSTFLSRSSGPIVMLYISFWNSLFHFFSLHFHFGVTSDERVKLDCVRETQVSHSISIHDYQSAKIEWTERNVCATSSFIRLLYGRAWDISHTIRHYITSYHLRGGGRVAIMCRVAVVDRVTDDKEEKNAHAHQLRMMERVRSRVRYIISDEWNVECRDLHI